MKTIYLASLIIATLTLTACATPQPYYYWHKNEVNQKKQNKLKIFVVKM